MGNAASALPYAIGKQVSMVNDGWALHEGSRKADNAAVTVFMAKKPALAKTPVNPRKSPQMTQLAAALHHFHHCKKLRHPHILQVYATLDTDNPNESAAGPAAAPPVAAPAKVETGDLIIVTEPCVSLETWLQTSPPPEQIAWGLESVVRALHFLHTSAALAHGNLSPTSFFVTRAGDVKLWNFSLVTTIDNGRFSRHFLEWEGLITPDPYRSPERIEARWDALAAAGIHAMDSFGVGVFIQHIFRHNIPAPLVKAVQRLETPNLKMRPRLQPLLKCPVFETPYQKIQLQLEEFTVQPVEQKIHFWQNLTSNLQHGLLPQNMAVYKLLPLIKQTVKSICQSDSMRTQDLYRREVLATIQPMFFIGESFLGDKVNEEIGPLIATLFTVNDRAIRGSLLQKISFLSQHLDNNALNVAVFEPACSGFSDSSATLRELTLKATLELVPKLTQPNLEKLSRYLVRLQSDAEPSIRTNTVIFFAKLAPHLTDTSREKMLLPAFVRALKDPFVPCRLSALKSLIRTKDFFDPQGISCRVLPVVTPQLLDASKDVRREAFVVVDDLLFHLRQESERMNALPDPQAVAAAATQAQGPVGQAPKSAVVPPVAAAAPPTATAPAPVSGGYLSGISSWMSSSKATTPTAVQTTQQPAVQQPAPQQITPTYSGQANYSAPYSTPPSTGFGSMTMDDASDGWGDEDHELDLSGKSIKTDLSPASKTNILFEPPPPAVAAMNDDDDFFGSFEAKPIVKAASLQRSSTGKLVIPASKNKVVGKPIVAVTKLQVDAVEDGWDDF